MEVERAPRRVTVESLTLGESAGDQEYELLIACSKGLYVRTLIADIGEALGCGAAMSALRRLRAGGFSIEDAITLEQAAALAESGRLEEAALCADVLFTELPALHVLPRRANAPSKTARRSAPHKRTAPAAFTVRTGRFWGWEWWQTGRRESGNHFTKTGGRQYEKTMCRRVGLL